MTEDKKLTFDKKRTHIIAELGNIHLHDQANCRQAVKDAFSAGADLVKLQCINPLTAWWASKEQLDRYKRIAWDIQTWIDFLSSVNKQHDNKVFVSTFDELFIEPLSPYVSYWKVAYRMREDKNMIAKMIWSDKPIFFSTRGQHYPEDNQKYFGRGAFYPLFATRYDKKYDHVAPQVMKNLRFGKYAGVSINFGGDYCMNLSRSIASVSKFIEVHVQGDGANGPDTEWSLTFKQLEKLKSEVWCGV